MVLNSVGWCLFGKNEGISVLFNMGPSGKIMVKMKRKGVERSWYKADIQKPLETGNLSSRNPEKPKSI